eukprot:gene24443-biopygen8944
MGLETVVLHRNYHVWCPDGSGQALGHNPCLYISFIPAAASRWEGGAGVWRLQYGPPVHVCVISEQDNTCHIEEAFRRGTLIWHASREFAPRCEPDPARAKWGPMIRMSSGSSLAFQRLSQDTPPFILSVRLAGTKKTRDAPG